MSNEPIESRHYVRHPVHWLTATCMQGDTSCSYWVGDVSLGGAFLQGAPVFAAGEAAEIIFSFPNGRQIQVKGRVARRKTTGDQPGMGIEFYNWAEDLDEEVGKLEASQATQPGDGRH
jgi:hypothetical protein